MPHFLRQSTASQEIPLGPFVDDTDGKTAETALSIANTDIKIWKSGGTSEASKNSGGATHITSGRYYAVLDATDTDTIGNLRASIHVAGALPVWLDCVVLDEAVYDSLFGNSSLATADLLSVLATASAVGTLATAADLATVDGIVDAIKAKTDNLPSDPADQSAVEATITAAVSGLNNISTADILAATTDGVAVSKVLEMLVAFVSGKASVSSSEGVSTITYKKQDGTTTSFTCVASETDGTRATTGSLS